jgi:hypothetical protein
MKQLFPLIHGATGAFDLMALARSGISPRLLAHAERRQRPEHPEASQAEAAAPDVRAPRKA